MFRIVCPHHLHLTTHAVQIPHQDARTIVLIGIAGYCRYMHGSKQNIDLKAMEWLRDRVEVGD